MRIIALNATNVVPNGLNSTLVYKFPNSVFFKNTSIAVSTISLYYSWFNISASLGNNIIQYTWTSGVITTTYTITIPDGLYEINVLNALIQFNLIQAGQYLIDVNGDNVYYIEVVELDLKIATTNNYLLNNFNKKDYI